jgi:hypothetical protein
MFSAPSRATNTQDELAFSSSAVFDDKAMKANLSSQSTKGSKKAWLQELRPAKMT